MPFNTTTANNILDWAFGKTELSRKNAVYIGLSSTNPEGEGGTFTELAYTNYARVLLRSTTYNPEIISSADEREVSNTLQINWPKTPDIVHVKGIGLFDSKTYGTPYWYAKVDMTTEEESAGGIQVPAGAVPLFDPGELKIYFTDTDIIE